ncbi:MAG: molecular chaperone DnaK [Myxococcota bacterium]|jgi:molecular chaperone DnaK
MSGWSLDLGTTNCGIARWDATAHRPRLLELPDLCRTPGGEDHLEAPRLIPSAVHLVEPEGFWGGLGTWRMFRKRLWGRHGYIGREALDRNEGERKPSFVPSFKASMLRSPMQILGRVGQKTYTARDVAHVYLRELVKAVQAHTGVRLREVTITTPVDAFESYRAEVQRVCRSVGIKTVHFIDEPVAAAVGYGLSLQRVRHVLVVDFGAGTLDVALVKLTAKGIQAGSCEVIAKAGRQIGGNLVDRWLVREFCERLDFPLHPDAEDDDQKFWYRLMLSEARRVKESVFFKKTDAFYLTPPEEMRAFEARVRGDANLLEVTQGDIQDILERRGLYREMTLLTDQVLADAAERGVAADDLDDVLMVGGSTLLPNVYTHFESRFGRDRVRAWQPFEAVAYGACAFAANSITQSDFIVHDYAFVTYDPKTHDPQYTVIVPKGTRFPAKDIWKRQLVPTCSLGEPEHYFKLVICEIGDAEPEDRRFSWDAAGQLHKLGGKQGKQQVVVHLNEANPTLGYLKPPHAPSDRRPRLEISFGVNVDRWLAATVVDLQSKRVLLDDEPVVRLL